MRVDCLRKIVTGIGIIGVIAGVFLGIPKNDARA
jgi:hypothetical protein